jgi:hypothetical protein
MNGIELPADALLMSKDLLFGTSCARELPTATPSHDLHASRDNSHIHS